MAPAYQHGSIQAPRSVQEIVEQAQDFDHKNTYPLRIALRTAQNILNQAANYEREGNVQDAYLFLYRHAEFCISRILNHADAKQPEHRAAVMRVRKEVQSDFAKLEELRPEVKWQYEQYQEALRRRDSLRAKAQEERSSLTTSKSSSRKGTIGDTEGSRRSTPEYGAQVLHASEHPDLALKLAQREQKRRDASKRSPDEAGMNIKGDAMDDLSRDIRDIGQRLEANKRPKAEASSQLASPFHYPSVPSHSEPQQSQSSRTDRSVPNLPPKNPITATTAYAYTTGPPPVPAKPQKAPQTPLVPPRPTEIPALPPKEDLSASSNYTFKATALSESGQPLRTLFLPTELRSQFLSLARPNTLNNLETCGILCGTLISNALFISHLVIPDQISTSDTCDTTDEGDNALFDYVDGEQLMVCGWIHTHPSQTCFLSSRDLHTSVGYQVMLPESVAIVCAPSKNPDHGIFRLTDPPGKEAILNCHQQGLFHPHSTPNLYTDALRPGHVSELKGLQFQVVDLRKPR